MSKIVELRQRRASLIEEAGQLLEQEDYSEERYVELNTEIDDLGTQIERLERHNELQTELAQSAGTFAARGVNFNLKTKRGDNEASAVAHFVRTGDLDAVRGVTQRSVDGASLVIGLESRANDTTMNVTTAADGGAIVPEQMVREIVARRSEGMLAEKLGVRRIPGKGLTVPYPVEDGDPNAFAATAEQDDDYANDYERDAPKLATVDFTLAKATKKVVLTEEILQDEDAGLLAFLGDHIGRAMSATHNAALVAAIEAGGTKFKEFASDSAIAAGEPEDIIFNDTLAWYLDDSGSAAWVMRPSTYGAVVSLRGDARAYGEVASNGRRPLLGYPVHYSNAVDAIGAEGRPLIFGNFYFVGMREEPRLSVLRDPFSIDGAVVIKYAFRYVYKVLQAGAIGYGEHPAA